MPRASGTAFKLLEQVNVKIGNVLSDLFGVSGQSMLLALLKGEASPEQIAQLARGQARNKIPQLIEALEGHRSRGRFPASGRCRAIPARFSGAAG